MKDDLISRQAALDALGERPMPWTDDDYYVLGGRNQYDSDRLAIESVPTIDAVPVVHGRWQWISSTYDRIPCEKRYWCSKCHHETITHDSEPWEKFCPNCGARMDGKDGDQNG